MLPSQIQSWALSFSTSTGTWANRSHFNVSPRFGLIRTFQFHPVGVEWNSALQVDATQSSWESPRGGWGRAGSRKSRSPSSFTKADVSHIWLQLRIRLSENVWASINRSMPLQTCAPMHSDHVWTQRVLIQRDPSQRIETDYTYWRQTGRNLAQAHWKYTPPTFMQN